MDRFQKVSPKILHTFLVTHIVTTLCHISRLPAQITILRMHLPLFPTSSLLGPENFRPFST